MIKLISLVVLLVGSAISAPAPDMGQQFLILTPQTQLQLGDSVKLQQPLLQPLVQLGRIEAPQQQMLLYYPDGMGGQFQLKQNSVWQQFLSYFGIGQQTGDTRTTTTSPIDSAPTEAPASASSESAESPAESSETSDDILAKQVMFEKDAETFEVNNPMPQMPAVPSVPQIPGLQPEHRFFILSGNPQFFGNFNPLLNPISPINPLNPVFNLQPLQTIKTRSTDNQIQTESAADVKVVQSADVEQHLVQPFAPVVPLEPGVPLQLRSSFESPLSELKLDGAETVLVLDGRSRDASSSSENLLIPAMPEAPIKMDDMSLKEEMIKEEQIGEMEKEMMKSLRKEEQKPVDAEPLADPSLAAGPAVAEASPSGIAVAGPGGIAQSAPLSTAYAGDGGIAVAAPYATAVAGDFLDGQIDESIIKATDNDKKIL